MRAATTRRVTLDTIVVGCPYCRARLQFRRWPEPDTVLTARIARGLRLHLRLVCPCHG